MFFLSKRQQKWTIYWNVFNISGKWKGKTLFWSLILRQFKLWQNNGALRKQIIVSLTDEKVVQPFLLLCICTVSYSFKPFLVPFLLILWLTVNITEIPTLKGPTEVFLLFFIRLIIWFLIITFLKNTVTFFGIEYRPFSCFLKKVYLTILLTHSRHMLKE